MNKAKISFSSITYTLRAKEIIEANGGKAVIGRKTRTIKNEGCGYFLTVFGDVNKFSKLLGINKVKYLNIEMIQ